MLILARRAQGTPVLQQNNKIRKHTTACVVTSHHLSAQVPLPTGAGAEELANIRVTFAQVCLGLLPCESTKQRGGHDERPSSLRLLIGPAPADVLQGVRLPTTQVHA